MASKYCVNPEIDDKECDCLLDLLDGEAVIVKDGICFSHNVFLNDKCMECGNYRIECPVYIKR